MLRGITKDLTVVVSQTRALPVIETGWEKYPFYYECTGHLDFVDYYGMLRSIYKGDFIVWDNKGRHIPMRKNIWNKLYGNYLVKGEETNVTKCLD